MCVCIEYTDWLRHGMSERVREIKGRRKKRKRWWWRKYTMIKGSVETMQQKKMSKGKRVSSHDRECINASVIAGRCCCFRLDNFDIAFSPASLFMALSRSPRRKGSIWGMEKRRLVNMKEELHYAVKIRTRDMIVLCIKWISIIKSEKQKKANSPFPLASTVPYHRSLKKEQIP